MFLPFLCPYLASFTLLTPFIVNVKTNFVLNVYAAPGACREAADFLSRPFASAGGGYSKRQYICRLL
jgi:hypothetical protein